MKTLRSFCPFQWTAFNMPPAMLQLTRLDRWLLGVFYVPALAGVWLGVEACLSPLDSNNQTATLLIQVLAASIALSLGILLLMRPSDVLLALTALTAFLSLSGTLVWRIRGAPELLEAGLTSGRALGSTFVLISSLLFLVGAALVLLRTIQHGS